MEECQGMGALERYQVPRYGRVARLRGTTCHREMMGTPERGLKPDHEAWLDARNADAVRPAELEEQRSTEPSTLPRSGSAELAQYGTREDLQGALNELRESEL